MREGVLISPTARGSQAPLDWGGGRQRGGERSDAAPTSRWHLQPHDERALVPRLAGVGAAVQPPEHVRLRPDLHVAPTLIRNESGPRTGHHGQRQTQQERRRHAQLAS